VIRMGDRKIYRMRLADGEIVETVAASEQQARARIARRLAARTAGKALRERRRNQRTGVTVELVDTHHPDSRLDPDGGRWATVCIDHGGLVNHDTLAIARSFLSVPWEFCPDCQETISAGGG